eukprot:jgi/Bigna1/91114/estExt_fgenesh1_pg.C_890012
MPSEPKSSEPPPARPPIIHNARFRGGRERGISSWPKGPAAPFVAAPHPIYGPTGFGLGSKRKRERDLCYLEYKQATNTFLNWLQESSRQDPINSCKKIKLAVEKIKAAGMQMPKHVRDALASSIGKRKRVKGTLKQKDEGHDHFIRLLESIQKEFLSDHNESPRHARRRGLRKSARRRLKLNVTSHLPPDSGETKPPELENHRRKLSLETKERSHFGGNSNKKLTYPPVLKTKPFPVLLPNQDHKSMDLEDETPFKVKHANSPVTLRYFPAEDERGLVHL